MSEKTQDLPRYINYKDLLLQKAKDYYEKKQRKEKRVCKK